MMLDTGVSNEFIYSFNPAPLTPKDSPVTTFSEEQSSEKGTRGAYMKSAHGLYESLMSMIIPPSQALECPWLDSLLLSVWLW